MSCNNHVEGSEGTSELALAVPSTLNKEAKAQVFQNGIDPVKICSVQRSEEEGKDADFLEHFYLNQTLPPEMLQLIFGYCDDKVLLTNRLVCKNWKLAFDSSCKLMGRFTFEIYDWSTFNESTIVDHVKSVRIYKAWKWNVNNRNWSEFCTRIGKSVRKISFEFVKPKNEQKKEFVSRASCITASLLYACEKLNELKMLNGDIVRYLSNTPPIPALSMRKDVRNLVLGVLANENPDTLKKLVDKFPNVTKLRMTQQKGSSSSSESATNNFLCEYIKANNGSLQEIQLKGFGEFATHDWLKFIFTSANHNVQLTFLNPDEHKSELNVHAFLSYISTEDAPINEKTCARYEKARLNIHGADQMSTTNRLGYCTSIKYFDIVFQRPAVLEELSFLPRLANNITTLELIISNHWEQDEENGEVQDNIIVCPAAAFVCEFPALQNLKLHGDLFGPTSAQTFSSLFLYFPNLQRIHISRMYNLVEHMFVHLSKLDALEEMDLSWLDFISDEMFTELCQSQRELAANNEYVPAIVAFNRLKILRVRGCTYLTDICIVDGIALNETLTFVSYDELGHVSIEAMENVGFSVNQVGDLVRTIN